MAWWQGRDWRHRHSSRGKQGSAGGQGRCGEAGVLGAGRQPWHPLLGSQGLGGEGTHWGHRRCDRPQGQGQGSAPRSQPEFLQSVSGVMVLSPCPPHPPMCCSEGLPGDADGTSTEPLWELLTEERDRDRGRHRDREAEGAPVSGDLCGRLGTAGGSPVRCWDGVWEQAPQMPQPEPLFLTQDSWRQMLVPRPAMVAGCKLAGGQAVTFGVTCHLQGSC